MTSDDLRKLAERWKSFGRPHSAKTLLQAADEIDRLKAVVEVRTQSWMNTADALSEAEQRDLEEKERLTAIAKAAARRHFMLAEHDIECRCCDCELRMRLAAYRNAMGRWP